MRGCCTTSVLDSIEDVQISNDAIGIQVKFILIKVSYGKVSKDILASSSAKFHADIFEEIAHRVPKQIKLEPSGGGRMHIDTNNKTIRIWGVSTAYGAPDYRTAEMLLKQRYQDFDVTSSNH